MITKTEQKSKKTAGMRKISVIQTRVDPVLREKTDAILAKLGLSTSDAIRIFLEQIILHRGLPFKIKLPQAVMPETTEWNGETELKFRNALDSIDKKYGRALKNLADTQ